MTGQGVAGSLEPRRQEVAWAWGRMCAGALGCPQGVARGPRARRWMDEWRDPAGWHPDSRIGEL